MAFKIDEINIEIDNIYIDNAIGDEDDSRKADLLKELAYRAEVISSLSSISSRFVTPTTSRPVSHDNNFIKPKLQCTNFDGKDCQKDTFTQVTVFKSVNFDFTPGRSSESVNL